MSLRRQSKHGITNISLGFPCLTLKETQMKKKLGIFAVPALVVLGCSLSIGCCCGHQPKKLACEQLQQVVIQDEPIVEVHKTVREVVHKEVIIVEEAPQCFTEKKVYVGESCYYCNCCHRWIHCTKYRRVLYPSPGHQDCGQCEHP